MKCKELIDQGSIRGMIECVESRAFMHEMGVCVPFRGDDVLHLC